MNKTFQTFKNSALVMLALSIASIFGIFRDVLIAKDFGLTIKSDLFFAALAIPFIFNSVIDKATKVIFVPIFTEVLSQSGKKDLITVLNSIFNLILLNTPLIIIIFYFLCPVIVRCFFYGFSAEYTPILIHCLFILSLTVVLNGIAAVQASFLHVHAFFFIPTIIKALMNVTIIAMMLILVQKWGIYGLSWSYLIGESVQPLFLFLYCKKVGYRFSLNIKSDAALKKGFKSMLLPTFTFFLRRSTILIERSLASFLVVGSIAALGFSYRIILGVLTLVSFSFFTATLPTLSKLTVREKLSELNLYVESNIKSIFYFSFPIMILLLFFNLPIVTVLFQRNNFDTNAAIMTSRALFYYSLGLAAFCQISSLLSVFYAFQDQWTPFKHLMFIMSINLLLDIIFMKIFGYVGIAAASSICNWLSFLRISRILKKQFNLFKNPSNLKIFYKKLGIASLCMMGTIALSGYSFKWMRLWDQQGVNGFQFIFLASMGITAYIGISYLMNMAEIKMALQKVGSKIALNAIS
jgi:putative peptidoglycan lipid II flippase